MKLKPINEIAPLLTLGLLGYGAYHLLKKKKQEVKNKAPIEKQNVNL